MAFAIIFLIFLSFSTIEAQQRSTNISLSSFLAPTGTNSSSWLSRSGLYAFGFYRQGSGYAVGVFAAGLPEKTVVWTANRDNPPVPSNATLAFNDGRLVLNIPPAQNTYIAEVESISAASMLDSGNFVLYNSVRGIIWQSFDYPTDTILPGQRLMNGKQLISSVLEGDHSTGLFRLKMQEDGNLVSYPLQSLDTAPYAYWASMTDGSGKNITLNLDGKGHLYLLNETGANIIKNITDGESEKDGKIYRMTFDADGIFRVYYLRNLDPKGNWSVMWYSSADKCDPRGLCGLNGYCVQNDTQADCRCLPGFNFINPEIWSLGCESNFAAVNCNNTNSGRAEFTMRELKSMQWEDQNYKWTEVTNKEDCEQSCLEDCHCEVALYSEGKYCQKQMLPLRYGRRSLGSSQVAFIKVPKEDDQVLAPKGTKKELRLEIILIIVTSLITFCFMVLTISGFLIY